MNIFDVFFKSTILIKIVILVLLSSSILSWSVIIYQIFILNSINKKIQIFENKFLSGMSFSKLYFLYNTNQNSVSQGIERIFCSGFKEFLQLYHSNSYSLQEIFEETMNIMKASIYTEIEELDMYIVFLNIIGSNSPYIGLFGTILSIIHVFFELGKNQHIILQAIAPNISEALIFTAFGLFVAIPAVTASYHLNLRVNNLEQKYNFFLHEFFSILKKQIVAKKIHLNKI